MKHVCVALLCSITVVYEAYAQDPTCDPSDATKCAVSLSVGLPAPFSGQLLTPSLAIDLGQKAEGCDIKLKLNEERLKKLCEIGQKASDEVLRIRTEGYEDQVKLLTERLQEAKKLQKPPWYERPVFVAVISISSTIAIFYGATEIVKSTR